MFMFKWPPSRESACWQKTPNPNRKAHKNINTTNTKILVVIPIGCNYFHNSIYILRKFPKKALGYYCRLQQKIKRLTL